MKIKTKFTEEIATDMIDVAGQFTVTQYIKRLKEKFTIDVSDTTLYDWGKRMREAGGQYPFIKGETNSVENIIRKTLSERKMREE
jgi:hypothetical protein